ncbi:MAG: hypothetical protein AAGI71_03035 [Bacteroidota bacterium]
MNHDVQRILETVLSQHGGDIDAFIESCRQEVLRDLKERLKGEMRASIFAQIRAGLDEGGTPPPPTPPPSTRPIALPPPAPSASFRTESMRAALSETPEESSAPPPPPEAHAETEHTQETPDHGSHDHAPPGHVPPDHGAHAEETAPPEGPGDREPSVEDVRVEAVHAQGAQPGLPDSEEPPAELMAAGEPSTEGVYTQEVYTAPDPAPEGVPADLDAEISDLYAAETRPPAHPWVHAATQTPAPSDPQEDVPAHPTADDELDDDILREIAAIRQQISKNEQLLSQLKPFFAEEHPPNS